MSAKSFIGQYEVLQAKRTFEGKQLEDNKVLVKLRRPGADPVWWKMDYDFFCKKIRRISSKVCAI